jgi:hypothetical protein
MTQHYFPKGNRYSANGNGAGRPAGSRTRLCRKLLEDLFSDWQEGGIAALKIMRIERPAEYCRLMASILPKELLFENTAVTELDDNELDHMISMLRERALAARQEQEALEMAPEQKLLNGRH